MCGRLTVCAFLINLTVFIVFLIAAILIALFDTPIAYVISACFAIPALFVLIILILNCFGCSPVEKWIQKWPAGFRTEITV